MKKNAKSSFTDFKSLSCLDRMVITGTSMSFGYETVMRKYCRDNGMDATFLADWARPLTERIRTRADDLAAMSGIPMVDCNKYKGRKDDYIKKLLAKNEYKHEDIIAVFKSMENCQSFYRSQSALLAKMKESP